MKLEELKAEVQKYQYLEETSIIDVSIASMVANRLSLGDPIWLLIIGASSGGKSQILRPLALTDSKFIHRVDDLTENTFLSASKAKAGEQISLLLRIGARGMIVISDFTVIMSKSAESRASILSQFRMIYDGEMTKYSGNSPDPIKWQGALGMLAGSTPSIYAHFEEVADMGERFIYYRMKEFNAKKATTLALSRTIFGKELDDKLSGLYGAYVKAVVESVKPEDVTLSDTVKERIIEVAMFAENVRTNAHKDWSGKIIDKIPVPAMPMRVALQLTSIAKGLGAIRFYETGACELTDTDLALIDWLGYSLANEENRACLRVLGMVAFDTGLTTTTVADRIGLDTSVTRGILQNLSAVGVLVRNGDENSLSWSFKTVDNYNIVRRIEQMKETVTLFNRVASQEDAEAKEDENEQAFQAFGR